MYALYIANKNYSSWSLRPWLLLRQLAIPFEERQQVFGAGSNYSAFRSFSPTGKVPTLIDGDTVVWESLAIVEYLAEAHSGVWPADRTARAWARSAATEMHAGFATLRTMCSMSCGVRARLNETPPALAADIARIDELWSEGLERFGGPFLAGPAFSAVDAFFAPVCFRVQTYGLAQSPGPAAYVERMLALPAMRAWYEAGLAEPWRDAGHDADVVRYATVTADLRRS